MESFYLFALAGLKPLPPTLYFLSIRKYSEITTNDVIFQIAEQILGKDVKH
jgi:hypothetical protein